MKKLILLFTIACAAGQLHGMEAQNIMDLPEDVRNEILEAVSASGADTLEGTIDLVKVKSALLGIRYDNLKTFTALMNVLAKKFPDVFRAEIAQKFNPSIAKEYVDVNSRLLQAIRDGKLEEVKILVDQENADPNFSVENTAWWNLSLRFKSTLREAILSIQVEVQNAEAILQFLLEKGMSPDLKFCCGSTRISEDLEKRLKQYSRVDK